MEAARRHVCVVELDAVGGGDLVSPAPAWLLGIFAFGQIKYGIWTITAWLLYWRSTAEILGSPDFSFDSISMTIAHIGLAAQGLFLLLYFRPTRLAALACLVVVWRERFCRLWTWLLPGDSQNVDLAGDCAMEYDHGNRYCWLPYIGYIHDRLIQLGWSPTGKPRRSDCSIVIADSSELHIAAILQKVNFT